MNRVSKPGAEETIPAVFAQLEKQMITEAL